MSEYQLVNMTGRHVTLRGVNGDEFSIPPGAITVRVSAPKREPVARFRTPFGDIDAFAGSVYPWIIEGLPEQVAVKDPHAIVQGFLVTNDVWQALRDNGTMRNDVHALGIGGQRITEDQYLNDPGIVATDLVSVIPHGYRP